MHSSAPNSSVRLQIIALIPVAMTKEYLTRNTGAFFNGVFLLALALSILLQSIERFVHVQSVDSPKLVLIVGSIGLLLNITSALVVHGKHL